MGFPVPMSDWFRGELRDFAGDLFAGASAGELPYLNPAAVRGAFSGGEPFGRKCWGLLSLEIWRQQMQAESRNKFLE